MLECGREIWAINTTFVAWAEHVPVMWEQQYTSRPLLITQKQLFLCYRNYVLSCSNSCRGLLLDTNRRTMSTKLVISAWMVNKTYWETPEFALLVLRTLPLRSHIGFIYFFTKTVLTYRESIMIVQKRNFEISLETSILGSPEPQKIVFR